MGSSSPTTPTVTLNTSSAQAGGASNAAGNGPAAPADNTGTQAGNGTPSFQQLFQNPMGFIGMLLMFFKMLGFGGGQNQDNSQTTTPNPAPGNPPPQTTNPPAPAPSQPTPWASAVTAVESWGSNALHTVEGWGHNIDNTVVSWLHLKGPDGKPVQATVYDMAFIKAESAGNPRALSSCGAVGLMQLMPGTARGILEGKNIACPSSDTELTKMLMYNPQMDVVGGDTYLQNLRKKYNYCDPLVAAAYNAGPGAVDGWLETIGDPRKGKISESEWMARIPYKETRAYVAEVMNNLADVRKRANAEGVVALNTPQHPGRAQNTGHSHTT